MGNPEACSNLELEQFDKVKITPEQYTQILSMQKNILEMIASNQETQSIMDRLCNLAESMLNNAAASIMLLNVQTGLMSVQAAPSIPKEGWDALEGLKPGESGGSCSNAVFRNEPQYVINTFKDARWNDVRQIAHNFNICSCWSMPIRDANKNVIGSFALSSFEHRAPTSFHQKLLETAAHIVSILLQNQEQKDRLLLFSKAMHNTVEGVVITDEHNHIIECNETLLRLYGYSEKELLGKNPKIFADPANKKTDIYKHMWHSISHNGQWSGEIANRKKDGTQIQQWLSISFIKDKNGKPKNYIGIFSDHTEFKQMQNKLHHLAYHDTITDLFNKTALIKEIKSSQHDKTLITLNINNFSYINANYGYDLGDEVLKEIALVLQNNFDQHKTYRVDSDVFALLFDEVININEKVKQIQDFFYNSTLMVDNVSMNISFTYGAVVGHNKLLRGALYALKQARKQGKNTLFILEKQAELLNKNKNFVERNKTLHMALLDERIIPYYQGIRDNKTGEINKFEVLARLVEGDHIISPLEFLQTAKLSGMLPKVTRSIIDKSFNQMSKNNFTFSINITEEDLNHEYLSDFLVQKSHQYSIDPSRVILEVLEGISAEGKEKNIKQLKELNDHGFQIAIDDFGSEYSNFERVLEMDIDFLKIDARYIKNIDTDEKSFEITRAITFFAHNVGIPVVAEFVHSQSVQNKLDELGIEFSQGYLFSEPSKQPVSL